MQIYKYTDSDHERERTACLRLLHPSLCCICLEISACTCHSFGPSLFFGLIERNYSVILRRLPVSSLSLSSGSAFSQRRSFQFQWSRCTGAALNGSKEGLCCKRNNSYILASSLSISLPSKTGVELNAPMPDRSFGAVWGTF